MRKRHLILILMVLLISIYFFQIFSSRVLGASSIATPSASPSVTSVPKTSPTPSGITGNPTPSIDQVLSITPILKTTSPSTKQVISPIPLPTSTPSSPKPTITPTPKPKVVAFTSNTPTPPPSIAKSLITFPKSMFSYIAPKDVYGTSTLPTTVSLEFLSLGCALVAIGMLVLRWEEGDKRVTAELKQVGVALRSWLL